MAYPYVELELGAAGRTNNHDPRTSIQSMVHESTVAPTITIAKSESGKSHVKADERSQHASSQARRHANRDSGMRVSMRGSARCFVLGYEAEGRELEEVEQQRRAFQALLQDYKWPDKSITIS